MANPTILFENVYEDGTISATTEASGFDADNVANWRMATAYRWNSTTTADQRVSVDLGVGNTSQPDTVVIAGHNLSTITATYRVQYSDNGSAWTSVGSTQTPTDDLPHMHQFTEGSAHRWWGVLFQSLDAVAKIGIITIGRRMDFEVGAQMDLDPYGEESVRDVVDNENGSPIGANIRYTRKRFVINYPEPGMTNTGFFNPAAGLTFDDDFIPHAIRDGDPFWFTWNYAVDTDETYLCRTSEVRMPFVGSTARRALSMTLEGYREAS